MSSFKIQADAVSIFGSIDCNRVDFIWRESGVPGQRSVQSSVSMQHNMCYLLLRLKLIIIFFLPYTPITHSVGRSSSRLVATSWHTFHVNVTPL